ncbi:phosphate regulon sensor histidine kinase PhoR [Reinekea forsetii]|nr:phosphate regulon sensor histidine kinase PhoR [Reinekea forsetii]
MIRDLRKSHYKNLAISASVAVSVGFVFGYPWLFLAAASASYLIWILYQQHRLISWLIKGAKNAPPNAMGLWGVVFDHLYMVRKKHRKQVRRYRETIQKIRTSNQALADGVITLDSNGNIESWNKAAVKLLNLKKVDEGHLLTNLIRDPEFTDYYNKAQNKEPITIENPAHANRSLQISMTVYGEGERLLLLRDTTRLEKLEKMRQDFVANASHELKTPITVVQGHLENILNFNDDIPPAMHKALLSMSTQAKRMNNLVNDLLILSKLDIDTTDAPMKEINIPDLMSQLIEDALQYAHSTDKQLDISFQCQTDAMLLGDIGQIRTALSNLIYNAVRYSPSQKTIVISWKKSALGGLLTVQDQGYGIEQHHIPRLTERFYRADKGRSSEDGGTGLGLAIVKHILNHHNAYLDIQSQPHIGSAFTCIFPKKRLSELSQLSQS